MSYKVIYSDSLSHHGILGQKWGVRRYQNEDGTLTEAGKKRYSGSYNNSAYKDLKKAVRKKKKEISGSGTQFAWSTSSGKNSEEALAKRRAFYNSPEYSAATKYMKTVDKKLIKDLESGKIDDEQYSKLWDEAIDKSYGSISIDGKNLSYYSGDRYIGGPEKPGRTNGYANEYLKGFGRDITVARLLDIGYDREGSEYIADYLTKYGRVLS